MGGLLSIWTEYSLLTTGEWWYLDIGSKTRNMTS